VVRSEVSSAKVAEIMQILVKNVSDYTVLLFLLLTLQVMRMHMGEISKLGWLTEVAKHGRMVKHAIWT
jgi:hypothetical protein